MYYILPYCRVKWSILFGVSDPFIDFPWHFYSFSTFAHLCILAEIVINKNNEIRSNQVSYEATDVGSWSFVGSNFPARNERMNEMIYKMNHILTFGYEIKQSFDPRSYERNFSNCVEKPEKPC